MVTWSSFVAEVPELAAEGTSRFEATGVALVGSLRSDGWPRISPVEPFIHADDLYLGMMWRSTKALDLLRDPRVLVHTVVRDKEATDGEFKVYGTARDVPPGPERDSYAAGFRAAHGFFPEGNFHCFAIDIEQVGMVQMIDGAMWVTSWRPGQPVTTAERKA